MIRKVFLAILFLVVVVGCSKVDDNASTSSSVGEYDSSSINFETQTTKATSSDVDTMKADKNGFVVYGLEANASSWYDHIDGSRYIYDAQTEQWGWETSQTPSWPEPFNQMNFYAFYPSSATGFTVSSIATLSIIGDIVVESSILDQTDYLASRSGDIVVKPSTGVLSLNFTHIMSKVSFSVIQDAGILTVIRQLGIENVINQGTYDYMNSQWYNLSNTNLDCFDDYVGSAGPFAKYGVENQVDPIRIDGHELMLIPQSGGTEDDQTPVWDGSITVDEGGELVPNGAYISIRYRTNSATEDLVGYAFRETSANETEWAENSYFYSVYKKDGGKYTGPLYVKAGFKLSVEQLDWQAGTEYDYTLRLNQTGGIYLSEYYYDVDGNNTKIRVEGAPKVGDLVLITDMTVGVTIDEWVYYPTEI